MVPFMSVQIHPTAIVDPEARLGEGVVIGPYSVVGANVVLDDRTELKSHVVVEGRTNIGADSVLYPFCSIGHAPQDLKYHGEESELIIGHHATIREHCTMNPGTEAGAMKTVVGNHGLFMMSTHVAHDCVVGDHVIMANNATLGGHVEIGDHVLVGGLAAVHQFVRIGSYAVIGGMSGVESDVIPYGRVKGERAFLAGLNLVGLERNGFDKEQIRGLQRAFNELFGEEGTMDQRIEMVANDFSDAQAVKQIIDFARSKRRFPLCTPQKKSA